MAAGQPAPAGAYPPGSKVPSVVQIAAEFAVVNSTAQRAMERVRAEGLTHSEKAWACTCSGRGSGTCPKREPSPRGPRPDTQKG
ncbi:GntR family transcriptional regulator [Actinacidiphila glaucinigra]|uniref:GntR family transcriptional regulator n=1 Tax=Actinacidiphila glaucinigra TaxID=235986 RepID=UPI00366DC519